jgi:hypothetical protein
MARKRTENSKSQASKQTPMAEMGERFERALTVVDAAITGALYAGIGPFSFEAVLCFEFLRVAAGLREKSESELDKWMKTDIFGQVVQAIVNVFEDARENVVDAMEADQFFALRAVCQDHELSVFELNRENEIALSIIEWSILKIAEDEELEMVLVELALLVCWLKVAALGGSIEAETYIKVRHDPPRLLMSYHDVLE